MDKLADFFDVAFGGHGACKPCASVEDVGVEWVTKASTVLEGAFRAPGQRGHHPLDHELQEPHVARLTLTLPEGAFSATHPSLFPRGS